MGLAIGRLNFIETSPDSVRQRSQQNETMYSFYNQTTQSLNKKFFSNYFLMAGEKFEVDEPDYLFGDEYDLNFLSCSRPYNLPYKQAKENLLSLLNTTQKAIGRANRFRSPFSKFNNFHFRHNNNNSNSSSSSTSARREATNNNNNDDSSPSSTTRNKLNQSDENTSKTKLPKSPSKPLVMFVNIRKETLKLVSENSNNTNNSNSNNNNSKLGEGVEREKSGQGEVVETNSSKKESNSSINVVPTTTNTTNNVNGVGGGESSSTTTTTTPTKISSTSTNSSSSTYKIYNIQFEFDSVVDCSIRIFYFCTREITPQGLNYKPQHATYKSKLYYYKKGLEQKFDQQEHTFQPYLFDEDLLMYKPLDTNGNYNSGAVFPLVIHCVALNGPSQKQSYSLVATIEKSQLDDSYSIKPLKQLIFVDGVQYILQDIYGIEHKQSITNSLTSATSSGTGRSNCSNNNDNSKNCRIRKHHRNLNQKHHHHNQQQQLHRSSKENNNLSNLTKSHSLPLSLNLSSLDLDDNGSITSINFGSSSNYNKNGSNINNNSRQNRESSIRHKSSASDNAYECVICMSEDRDTMLLPCRHLCLCGSCAQSLRYQASSCPICRCTFKAALNLRPSNSTTSHQPRPSNSGQSSANATSKV